MRGTDREGGPEAERLSRRPRRLMLLGGFGLAALLIVGRAFQLQALEGEKWAEIAARQHQGRVPLPARRGAIFDRDGVPLALSRPTFRISVAPREVRDRAEASEQLVQVLGISPAAAKRATDPDLRWVVLPGLFSGEQQRRLRSVRGLHFERTLERLYPQGEVGRELLGAVSADGRALGGMEQEFDEVLRGQAGAAVFRRDARGRQTSTSLPVVPPRDGEDVYLSIDFDLQEIADGALREAIRSTRARGGDLLIADPRTGEILAAVSLRGGRGRSVASFTEPYEPGSTLKPFLVASLLSEGKASLGEQVFAENGQWRAPNGRMHRDVHPYGWLSVRDALRVSSNIGMVKLVPRLSPAEQFQHLRDFGFGTPTGIEYPAEAGGTLRPPKTWSSFTPASLATGYEIAVTPVQMIMAYAAIANGGVLMEPHLLREVRGPGGQVLRSQEPRPVRRVLSREVTDPLRDVLISVVEDGTATQASLANFQVAGKTGTARRTGSDGRYVSGSYTSTFVGFFPAGDPQLALFVKLDEPQGAYYGGLTAAPVTRETLQAILAARSSNFDRRSLLATRPPAPRADPADGTGLRSGNEGTYVFLLNDPIPSDSASPPQPVRVPSLEGASLRDAARRLHALGLHVRLRGSGSVRGSSPGAGTPTVVGDTVLLLGEAR